MERAGCKDVAERLVQTKHVPTARQGMTMPVSLLIQLVSLMTIRMTHTLRKTLLTHQETPIRLRVVKRNGRYFFMG